MGVKIDWDDDAFRKIGEQVGKQALDKARRAAEASTCPEHHQRPSAVRYDARTLKWEAKTCCERGQRAALLAAARALG